MADLDRLSAYVVARRVELGYRARGDLASASGLSVRTLADVECGRRETFHASTIAALEQALGWATGSVAQVIDGYEPTVTEFPQVHADNAIAFVMDSDIPEGSKARIAAVLIEDKGAADLRRLGLARALVAALLEATKELD